MGEETSDGCCCDEDFYCYCVCKLGLTREDIMHLIACLLFGISGALIMFDVMALRFNPFQAMGTGVLFVIVSALILFCLE